MITLPFYVFKILFWALGPNWAIFWPVKNAVPAHASIEVKSDVCSTYIRK
jgi:hypothetical protein